jgi:hypothetical protein
MMSDSSGFVLFVAIVFVSAVADLFHTLSEPRTEPEREDERRSENREV